MDPEPKALQQLFIKSHDEIVATLPVLVRENVHAGHVCVCVSLCLMFSCESFTVCSEYVCVSVCFCTRAWYVRTIVFVLTVYVCLLRMCAYCVCVCVCVCHGKIDAGLESNGKIGMIMSILAFAAVV